MESMKIIIADDDRPSRMLLSHFVKLLPEYEVIAEVADGEELIQTIMEEKPDIALVDINMPGVNGFEAVKMCREVLPSLQVIFTTGHDEFAVEAFKISAVDYIIKPIEKSRLFGALEKSRKLIQIQRNMKSSPRENRPNRLSIKSNNMYLYLSTDDILYIEKEGRKTIIHLVDTLYETTDSLQELERKLPEYFYKTHRSYLVNLKQIVKIESSGETYLAHFNGLEKVAHISKLKISEVQALLGN